MKKTFRIISARREFDTQHIALAESDKPICGSKIAEVNEIPLLLGYLCGRCARAYTRLTKLAPGQIGAIMERGEIKVYQSKRGLVIACVAVAYGEETVSLFTVDEIQEAVKSAQQSVQPTIVSRLELPIDVNNKKGSAPAISG